MADLLARKRSKAERWSAKSKQQATQIFDLLARFMKEERGIENMSAVRQKDLAALANFLETEIYKHHGKGKNDKGRSIAEMRIIALSKPEELRGLEPGTLNRHLTFIDQQFDLAEAEGVELDSSSRSQSCVSSTTRTNASAMNASSCHLRRSKICSISRRSSTAPAGIGFRKRVPRTNL